MSTTSPLFNSAEFWDNNRRCECGFIRWDCGDCKDTLIVTQTYGEDSSEYQIESACEKCDPDMRAAGDSPYDWHSCGGSW
tara:strand:+ start:1786 stop:2025 length:240 start_codon:yes stop_codon:yes gene_type:complete